MKGEPLPCPHQLNRPSAQILAKVVEQKLERAVAPDHPREDVARHRLRRGEQHRLDRRLPFPPA